MKDEIKEILDEIGYHQHIHENLTLSPKELDILVDYITNLQEERNMFKNSFETMSKNYFEEKSRNEKAIEYIKDNLYYLVDNDDKNLLNILNGGDDNE